MGYGNNGTWVHLNFHAPIFEARFFTILLYLVEDRVSNFYNLLLFPKVSLLSKIVFLLHILL